MNAHHQTVIREAPGAFENAFPAIAVRHSVALGQLQRQFDEGAPLTVLTGAGKFEINHVIGRFVADLGEDCAVVRLTRAFSDATHGMRAVNRALGFDPKQLGAGDLQKILSMFLAFQKKHKRRTVIAIEQLEIQAAWLLDNVRQLVEAEVEEEYGLMVILAGRPKEMSELFDKEPLQEIYAHAGHRIKLEPFTPAETLEFVRQRIDAADAGDVSQIFDFGAITELHEQTGGVPDEVAKLCCKCLQLANESDDARITEDLVNRAAAALKTDLVFASSAQALDETLDDNLREISVVRQQLTVRLNGDWVQELTLNGGSVLIGRGDRCDVNLPSKIVSRNHAVIVRTDDGLVLRDLGSTNGTYVGAYRIDEYELQHQDVIRIGDFLIEYNVSK